jgi:hypothetical protein
MASSSLIQVMEELLQAIEQRDAGDPDAPAWRPAPGSNASRRSSSGGLGKSRA